MNLTALYLSLKKGQVTPKLQEKYHSLHPHALSSVSLVPKQNKVSCLRKYM